MIHKFIVKSANSNLQGIALFDYDCICVDNITSMLQYTFFDDILSRRAHHLHLSNNECQHKFRKQ